jgi:hypothetical protein
MSNFLENALKQFPNRSHVLLADNIPYINSMEVTGEEGGRVYVHRQANQTEVSTDAFVAVQPSTSTPANLNGAIVDFKPQNIIDRWDHAYLKISLTNNDASSCTVTPSPLLLQSWQLFGQNGNSLLFQQYGYEIWVEVASFSNTFEWAQMLNLVGSSSAYATTGVVIAAGASTNLYIPLASVFMPARLFLEGLNDNVLIRFNFQPSTLNLIAGVTPTVTQIQLLLRGSYETKAVREMRMKMYKTLPLDFPFMNCQRTNYPLTIAASSNYKIQLQGINGLVNCLWIWAWPTPTTASNAGTFSDIWSTFDITDQSGNSILGYYIRDVADTTNFRSDNQISTMEYFDNTFSLNKVFLFVSFSRTPVDDWRTGSSRGFQPFDGFNVLNFTTKSTATPGAYNIVVACRTANTLKVRKGILSCNPN